MLTVATALVGSVSPQAVQVSVSGLASGDAYEVVGVWSGGTWPVRGGIGTSNGSLLVLNDLASPINVPVTYRVMAGVDVVDSAPVIVNYARRYALSSIDGRVVVPAVQIERNGMPRQIGLRPVMFNVPGRSDPVVVTDRPTSMTGEYQVLTDDDGALAMEDLLGLGGLALLRSDGLVRGVPATSHLVIAAAASVLLGVFTRWTLSYRLTSDPEPGTVPAVSTWDDVDVAYAGLTWADLEAEWAGQTWDDFDTYDWSSRASA